MSEKSIISNKCCDCPETSRVYFVKALAKGVTPKSLANENCVSRSMYDCSNTRITKKGSGPVSQNNMVLEINEPDGLTKNAPDFYRVPVTNTVMANGKIYKIPDNKCSQGGITTYCDPRLRDARTGQLLKIDATPHTGSVNMGNIYDEHLRGFGKNYTSYLDVNGGQIQYYVPLQDVEAVHRPNYTLNSTTMQTIRQDPMGGLIPEYHREPVANGNRYASNYQDTRDQLKFREDIMDGLMYRQRKENYGLMWSSGLLGK